MAWWNPLSWGTKTVDDVFDKDSGLLTQVGSWVGNMNFTDEERAEYNMKVADKVSEFVGSTLSENTVRSQTRRNLASNWFKLQIFLIIVTAVSAPFDMSLAKFYFNLATSDIMLWVTGSITVFFFGAYVWGAHISRGAMGLAPPKKKD